MEPTLTLTRTELIEAFRKWHADVPKDADGNMTGPTPDDPEGQTDILIGYLNA